MSTGKLNPLGGAWRPPPLETATPAWAVGFNKYWRPTAKGGWTMPSALTSGFGACSRVNLAWHTYWAS